MAMIAAATITASTGPPPAGYHPGPACASVRAPYAAAIALAKSSLMRSAVERPSAMTSLVAATAQRAARVSAQPRVAAKNSRRTSILIESLVVIH